MIDTLLIDDTPTINPTTFCLQIEDIVKRESLDYFEATLVLCQRLDIEIPMVSKLITETMKEKIEMSADKKNLLKKENI